MKRKHSEAAHAKRRLQDAYIEGLSDDEQALEALEWHDDYTSQYGYEPEMQHEDELIPF
jgi:hypothetical protein